MNFTVVLVLLVLAAGLGGAAALQVAVRGSSSECRSRRLGTSVLRRVD